MELSDGAPSGMREHHGLHPQKNSCVSAFNQNGSRRGEQKDMSQSVYTFIPLTDSGSKM